jgi:imidazoleglycerol-phosphate dehydratase/histidinol-phosphatase
MSRYSRILRETKETKIELELDIDNPGNIEVKTPVPFFDHMLNTLLFFMRSSGKIVAEDKQNYDDHHVIEDTAIALGLAIKEALGNKEGIKRFSSNVIPMDEALVMLALDISGRGYSYVDLKLKREQIGGFSTENVSHFFGSLAQNAGITLHLMQIRGENDHHIIEASFKALGISLYEATRIMYSGTNSTKGIL